MSVNITVNSKFSKYCKTNPLLDPVKAKKEEEEARRKVRLLQVREQSKKIAEKIRNGVKESMRKQKQKYEATVADEFNCWRHHALHEKMNDYRTAVFQIGTAHAAAKTEVSMQCEKRDAKRKETYKQFRKQMAARQKDKGRLQHRGPCICNKVQDCADDQFECACNRMEDNKPEEPHKRKRDACFSSCDSASSTDDETSNDATLNDSSISSCVMPCATTAFTSQNIATQTSLICPSANLKKTPAVFLDVEEGSEDSVLVTAPAEIKDRHAEYNQQYSSVIRESPRRARRCQDNNEMQVEPTPSLLSSEQSTEMIKKTKKSFDITCKKKAQPIAQAGREKRFTLISDLVKKQQGNMERPENTSPTRRQLSAGSNSRASPTRSPLLMPAGSQNFNSKVTSPRKAGAPLKSPNHISKLSSSPKGGGSLKSSENLNFKVTSPRKVSASSKSSQNLIPKITSPRKASASSKSSQNFISKLSSRNVGAPLKSSSNYIGNVTSPRKASASSKSTRFIADKEKRSSVSISAASGNTNALGSSCGTSGRVQFFDYNSKLSKDGLQDRANVTVNRQDETEQLTAMDQAAIENRLRQDRQQDVLNRNQQMEELGQKALEREQARRDCDDLTEKLEALTRQYPRQLPTSDNTPHIFVDKQLRKEGKMNTAIENLLSRPNIITCTEVNNKQFERSAETKPLSQNIFPSEINVGMASDIPAKDASSDSCCSILLGYVDDQSRQVRKDLEMWPEQLESNEKQIRLNNLLKRLDKMRNTLIQELKSVQSDELEKNQTSTRDEQFADLIDTITKCRQERESIMIDSIIQPKGQNKMDNMKPQSRAKDKRPLDARENALRLKEDLLEKKVREFYEIQKQQKKKSTAKSRNTEVHNENAENIDDDYENKENLDCSSLETPVQIVITVQGESKCISIPAKTKKKTPAKKKPTQLATLIKSPQPTKKLTPKKKAPVSKQPRGTVLGRQNSYDSNSTSYMSLPPRIPNELGNMVNNLQQERQHSTTEDTQTSLEFDNETRSNRSKEPVAPLNPLVAQYIQRLLGMSRKAVQRLGVSSSEIETPGSSIVNTTDNLASQDSVISDERMAFVESFMQENYSFIKELEQSFRANNQSAMENSVQIMDDIWRKRLKQQKSQTDNKAKHDANTKLRQNLNTCSKAQKYYKEKNAKEKQHTPETVNKADRGQKKINENGSQQQNLFATKTPFNSKKPAQEYANDVVRSPKVLTKETSTATAKNDNAIGTRYPANSNTPESDAQIARYAQLTENCTHRIAELTELISRVRQEKQRLLEVTLSSVSDTGRTSTEYLELPTGKSHITNEPAETSVASSSDFAQNNKKQPPLEMGHQAPKLSALDKNRHITASQDSGIAESRPITAQENRNDIEPISHTSTDSQVINAAVPQRKQQKPPAVLRRFSPQFQEEELVHELSTILEVDTPANSRINTAIGQTPSDDRLAATEPLRQPVMFPTFQEYVKQLNLDITLLDAEQSTQLQHEFSLYIEDLQKSRTQENPQYKEFPPINAFLSSSKADNEHHETIDEESVGQMRIKKSIRFERFPDVRGYVQQQQQRYRSIRTTSPSDEQKMLDTESLENLTDLPTNSNTDNDNDTASIDIEQELKRRNILKKSFRYTQNSGQIFSSTAHQDAAFYDDIIAAESGVEKLSTSENTVPFLEADMKRLVRQWPTYAKHKEKQQHGDVSSTTASTKVSNSKRRDTKCTSLDDSSSALSRPLNLHDFLKRELLKHVHLSDSTNTSSSDVSLRSQFLYSLIGTLTPVTTSKSGQQTLDRQKTSTPVPTQISPAQTTPSNPSRASSSQLFSGESRISSVHMNDRSHRFQNTSEGVNGDQSSN